MKATAVLGAWILLVLLSPGVGRADPPLPEDPEVVRGRFENGVGYLIRPHQVPPGRVAMYLHVRAGALDETAEQNGLAHFLEHMAFQGSAHYPPGQLLPYLNSIGMAFGVHSNAHTGSRETVYKLFMPDNRPQTVTTALTIFADYADGLLLEEAKVEAERGVVLAEMRSREGVAMRVRRKLMAALYPEAKLTRHDTLGESRIIERATRQPLLDYWNAHYRPQTMTLIVVGDIDPQAVIAEAQTLLGEFKARAPAVDRPAAGLRRYVDQPSRAVVLSDPEMVRSQVVLSRLVEPRPAARTEEQFRADEAEDIALWLLNRRLSNRLREGKATYQAAGVSVEDMEGDATSVEIKAAGPTEAWNRIVDEVVGEVSAAGEYGFTEAEVELAKRTWLSTARDAVKTVPTMDARAFLDSYSQSLTADEPMISPAQRVGLLERVLPSVTPEDLRDVIRRTFVDKRYATVLLLPEPKDGDSLPAEDAVQAATAAAWARRASDSTTRAVVASRLPAPGEPGPVRSTVVDEPLGVTSIEFENGVVMHHRFVDYKKNHVVVQLTLPGGRLEETADNKGVSAAATAVFARPATRELTSNQLNELLTGRGVSVGGTIGVDAMTLQVAGAPDDLELGLAVARAVLTEARLEQPAFDEWVRSTTQRLRAAEADPAATLRRAVGQTVFGDDPRLTDLDPADVARQDRGAAEQWFNRIAGSAAIEIAVVGDLSVERARELGGRYFGTLPRRERDLRALDPLRVLRRADGPYERATTFNGVTPRGVAAAGFIGADYKDADDRRALNLAARVLTERMTDRLRQKEQLVYSIQCTHSPGIAIPGTGTFSAGAVTDPQQAGRLADAVLQMMTAFAEEGPTEAELAAARLQVSKSLEASLREPKFWADQLADLRYRSRSLDELRRLREAYEPITAAQVRETVRRYLTPTRTVRITVVPTLASTTAPATSPVPAGGD